MLERLEDMEDLKMLADMRKKPLKFRALDNFLKEYSPGVMRYFLNGGQNGTLKSFIETSTFFRGCLDERP